ncbi:hypothetical protein GDO86_011052, partial [Hymenochirus boettgeri]
VSLQCACEWKVQFNTGKKDNGKILWKDLQLGRQKREWISPPCYIREEEDNRYRNPIAKVHSDKDLKKIIVYTISGPGVDREPYNIFILDGKTGYLNVTGVIVDREVISVFFLTVRAMSGGVDVEKPLSMRVKVMDINDNAPIFSQTVFVGSIAERSSANSLVMQIIAMDADEENTAHSQLAYKIISQSPFDPPMFIMNRYTGEVFTMSGSLDREATSSYSLVVSGADMDGAAGSLNGQCGATIQIMDVNDNFPILEYETYSVSIAENSLSQGLLWMKVFDNDEMFTDNWLAEFEIVSGNEGGWFVIETNPDTNEGILRVVQALNYEAMRTVNLGIIVRNRAPFHHSIASEYHPKVTNINVDVENRNEGYEILPNPLVFNVPSNLHGIDLYNYVVTTLYMRNIDTGEMVTNAVFVPDKDSAKWLFINEKGEVKFVTTLTAEQYKDIISSHGTATILGEINDTSALLSTQGTSEDRNVTVYVEVNNRNNCPTPVPITVRICECEGTICRVDIRKGGSAALGPAAIGLLIMGFLALLVAPLLLLLCLCGPAAKSTFVPVAAGNDGGYHQWVTEGAKPEDVKADAFASEDESRPANDCLLIYDNEGVGSPAGSIGCCSFIDDDLDETFLDNLGTKFKTLAEICSGKATEPVPRDKEPRLIGNIPTIETDTSLFFNDSTINIPENPPPPVNISSMVNERSFASSNLQPARPIHEPLIPANMVVTETYTTSGPPLKPATYVVEPHVQPNILVTERVVGPSSGVRRGFPEISDGSNVIVTERVLRPASGVHDIVDFPNLTDSSNVVLRERVIAPSTSRLSNTLNIPDLGDAQNVVVTERVIQPVTSVQGNFHLPSDLRDTQNVYVTERLVQPVSNVSGNISIQPNIAGAQNVIVTERLVQPVSNVSGNINIQPDLAGAQNVIVTEKMLRSEPLITHTIGSVSPRLLRSGQGVQSHVLTNEPLITRTIGSVSPSITRSKVTKYSTVQYAK